MLDIDTLSTSLRSSQYSDYEVYVHIPSKEKYHFHDDLNKETDWIWMGWGELFVCDLCGTKDHPLPSGDLIRKVEIK